MKLFDLHCDTAFLIHRKGIELYENDAHVSVKKAMEFDKYVQSFAFFASPCYHFLDKKARITK